MTRTFLHSFDPPAASPVAGPTVDLGVSGTNITAGDYTLSNAVITILSMGVSFGVAVASLTFLIVIHKLEYLINSRIVGGETDSQAWEILMAIIIGETAFGAGGIVIAPIVYAFVKGELRERGLI